jgi:amino acid adenylation domain-containing protein
VHALFRAQARRSPAAPALRFEDVCLSYAELDERVEALARVLASRGARPDALIGVCTPRSLEMVVGLLAIMRTGAAYVPIDPEAPAARIRTILQDSAPRFVLCHASMAEPFRETGVELLLLDPSACRDAREALPLHVRSSGVEARGSAREQNIEARGSAREQNIEVRGSAREQNIEARGSAREQDPDARAYVIFTSGSTGAPKGVEVRHTSLVNHGLAMAELYAIGPGDRVLCSASIGFDVAAEQIYPALISGAEVVVRPEDLFSSFERFDHYLRAASITTLMLPTALFHEWTRELQAGRLELPPSLRALGVGTEQVSPQLLVGFLEHAQGRVRFLQGYGPTETTVTCTAYVHDGRKFEPGDAVPIGLPLPNTEVYVLDEAQRLVADGEIGELYVGGVGLALGYLGRADLTRERFVPNPFAPALDARGTAREQNLDARLYRTGDLVRRAPDGQLTFVGRVDFQIKVRGHRVEPQEIENLLCEQPGISEALVMLREGRDGQQKLVAYVVSADAIDPTALALRCRTRLPSYMVPDAFVGLAAFPQTLNQKVDRSVLPDPAPELKQTKRGARNDVELLVARAFAEVLGVGELCIEDDFFALGGNSLRALRLLQLIRQGCSDRLGLADIFAAPNVAALSARIARGGTLDRPTVLRLKAGHGTPVFLVCGIHIYQQLADALPSPNPTYALLLPSEAGVAGEDPGLPSVERLAFEYVQALREHTPHGPYALGGLSFGGAVAYEMARQLEAAGQQVMVVGLFDTVLPRGRAPSPRTWLKDWLRSLPARIRRGPTRSSNTSPAPDAELLHVLEQRRQRAYGERLVEYDRAPRPYRGRVVLYRATHANQGRLLPGHGFEQLAPQLTLCDLPGDHLGILRDTCVRQLAAHLAGELATPTLG